MIGKQISHYKVVEKLGEGGMGVVYRVEDTKLKRDVALKFLPAKAVENEEDRERFVREAQAAAALDHPNICPVYEINEADGQHYIAMAYVEGKTIRECVDDDGPFDVLHALNIAVQIADGLSAAHDKGIVHRDIKSANIMVSGKGHARIMDFGLAHHSDAAAADAETSTLGTIAYGSPEQTRGDAVDHRTDIWSFGVTLYEMVTGRLPFKGDYESAIVYSVLNEPPVPVRDIRSDLPEELETIILKALSKNAHNRFASADEMADALRALRNSIDPHTSKVRRAEPAAPTSWFHKLTERHVLLSAFGYLAVVFLLVNGVDVVVDRFMLAPNLVNTVAIGLLSLLPSVILLAYVRGPRSRSNKPAMVGIPVNVVGSLALLTLMYSGEDLGAATQLVQVTDEKGQQIERVIPKGSFRQRFALYLFENKSNDASLDWLQYAMPLLVEYDVYQDMFVQTRSAYNATSFKRLKELGLQSWLGAPVALKRKVAAEFHMDNCVTGTIDSEGGEYVVTALVHNSRTGKILSEHTVRGTDVMKLADDLSVELKHAVGVPNWHLDGAPDQSVRDMLSESPKAVEEYTMAQKAIAFDQDWEAGLAHLESAVSEDSTLAFAYFDMYKFYRLANRGPEGKAALEACLRHDYKLPERFRFIVKANYYFGNQQPEKAYAVVRMMVDLYPEDVHGFEAMGQVRRLRGEYVEAIESYERILELDPYRYEYMQQIAETYTMLGEFEKALEYYERYGKEFPDDPDSYQQIGGLYAIIGDFDKAKENYDKALLIEPTRVRFIVDAANIDVKLGEFEAALQGYERALSLSRSEEEQITALRGLQSYCSTRGEIRKALDYAEQRYTVAAKIQAPLFSYLQKLSDLDLPLSIGRFDDALALMRDLEENLTTPYDKAIPFGYLGIHLESENADEAEEALAGVEEYIAAFNLEFLRPQYTFAEGRIHELRGEFDEAIARYKHTLDLSPTMVQAKLAMGRCYRKNKNYSQAEIYLTDAAAHDPIDGETQYELALLYHDRGDQAKANAHLAAALTIWADADSDYVAAAKAIETESQWKAAANM